MKIRSHKELVEYWKDREKRKKEEKLSKVIIWKARLEGHKGNWITLPNGQKVFIREGETVNEATERLKPRSYKVEVEEGLENPGLVEGRVTDLLRDVPKKDLEGLETIKVVEEADYSFEWKGETVTMKAIATYDSNTIEIEHDGLMTEAVGKGILAHEVGHHKYRNIGDTSYEWDKLWNRGIGHAYKFPSEYAKVNRDEGFAECYEDFRVNDGKNMDPIFTKWFKGNIGE